MKYELICATKFKGRYRATVQVNKSYIIKCAGRDDIWKVAGHPELPNDKLLRVLHKAQEQFEGVKDGRVGTEGTKDNIEGGLGSTDGQLLREPPSSDNKSKDNQSPNDGRSREDKVSELRRRIEVYRQQKKG